MRRLIVCNIVSLDGRYVEGPDWPLEIMDTAFDDYNAERLRSAGTLLAGRITFEGFRDFWPSVAEDPDPRWTPTNREISRINNAIQKVVVSDSLTPEATEPWRRETRIVPRDAAHSAVAELKQGDGGDILMFGSRTLWNDLLAGSLVDELHLMVGPIVLAAGTPAFVGPPSASLRLAGTRTWDGSGNVLLRYEVEPG